MVLIDDMVCVLALLRDAMLRHVASWGDRIPHGWQDTGDIPRIVKPAHKRKKVRAGRVPIRRSSREAAISSGLGHRRYAPPALPMPHPRTCTARIDSFSFSLWRQNNRHVGFPSSSWCSIAVMALGGVR
jgi:hypothetical protein